MAALGGFGQQVSENIESAKVFQREKDFKLELLAEEEATQQRLLKSRQRKEKNDLIEKVTAGLSAYVGTDHASAIIKQYGLGGAQQFLTSAQNYKGNFATAVKLPTLKNGVYGEDFANKPLMSLIPEETKEVDPPTTYADWEIRWLDEELKITKMPDGPAKKIAETEHQEKLENYYTLVKKREDAKREDKDEDESFYSTDQRMKIISVHSDTAFANITGFYGDRELYTKERAGTNIGPVSDYVGAIMAYNQNDLGPNDRNLKNDLIATAENARTAIINHGQQIRVDVLNKLKNGIENNVSDLNDVLDFGDRERRPVALYTETHFNGLVKTNSLEASGVYLVKTKDNKIKIVTYLGYKDVFRPQSIKPYIEVGSFSGKGVETLMPKVF